MWAARLYGWAPDVTRRQSYRDLLVLIDAHSELLESQRARI